MSRFISKKRALLTAAVTSLALVAVAIAFYTTAGSGSGTGSTAANYANNLAITGNLDNANLVPGGSVGITGNVHNPNTGSARVSTVTGTVVAGAADTAGVPPAGDCKDSWFHVADKAVNAVLLKQDASNTDDDAAFTTTISMDDVTNANQDDCKSAALAITWSSAQ